LVSDPGNGIAATSATWAKKHVFGWSDEEIKTDLLQQRFERAIGEELKGTPTVITKTGIFDTIDKLYANQSGGTVTAGAAPSPEGGMEAPMGGEEMGGGPPPPPTEAPPPAEEGGAVTPESMNNKMNILVEKNLLGSSKMIDFDKGQDSLIEMDSALDKLLNS